MAIRQVMLDWRPCETLSEDLFIDVGHTRRHSLERWVQDN